MLSIWDIVGGSNIVKNNVVTNADRELKYWDTKSSSSIQQSLE